MPSVQDSTIDRLHRFRKSLRGTFSVLRLCGVVTPSVIALMLAGLVGCQAIQNRTTKKSARCGALCEQAREARDHGNKAQANRCLDEAVKQKPTDLETRRQLADTLWNSGRRDEALRQFATLYDRNPKDAKIATRYASLLWEDGQQEKAAEIASAALLLDSHLSEAWRIKARSEVLAGHLDDALVSYIQLSQLEPDDWSTLKELGELYLRQGHPERACSLLLAASQDSHSAPAEQTEIEWLLGVAYARNERWCEAVATLERSIDQRKSTSEDWCLLSWTRWKSGDLEGAKADLKKALDRNPSSVAARRLAEQIEHLTSLESGSGAITPVVHQATN